LCREGSVVGNRHPFVLPPIFVDPDIPNPALTRPKAFPAELATKRVNVKLTDEMLDQTFAAHPSSVIFVA